ncbi:MAG: pseudouridine synthase [Hungatella sp.]
MTEKIRLDKYLVEMGLGSRSQIKEAAKKGRIQVNEEVETKTERKIDPQEDRVLFDSRRISYIKTEYYMLNKPCGVVSATRDNLHSTVLDLLEDRNRSDLFPVGRLDIDTEGLLLITNDGALAHRLLSPRHHVDKVYQAVIEGRLPQDAIQQFWHGITLTDGTITLPAVLTVLEVKETASPQTTVLLTIQEGKFHQVKRMFEALDCQVLYLKRKSMGCLLLDETLAPGEYRMLREDEILQLQQLT